jgi:hypothetical protein
MLRVAARTLDAEPLVRGALVPRGIGIRSLRGSRPSVEDAFVAMVGDDKPAQGSAT